MNDGLRRHRFSDAMKSSQVASRRCDMALVERGLASSRTRAQALIDAGSVLLNGAVVGKPSVKVTAEDDLRVVNDDGYVSRGAWKLVGAFDTFDLPSVDGALCLDIGASTGGFTQVLLQRGASQVIALDVGHGQLAPRVARDPRVIDMSGTNIRDVTADDLPYIPSWIVSDVSFISLTYVIPVIARILAPSRQSATVILLIKPQFEVGKGNLGKNGIVHDPQLRRKAIDTVCECARQHGFVRRGLVPSPIEGTHGNEEFLLWLQWPVALDRSDPQPDGRV